MFPADFVFVLKRVLSSPLVIGIVIFAILYFKLTFFIAHYHKKTRTPLKFRKKLSKEKSNQKTKEKRENTTKEASEEETK